MENAVEALKIAFAVMMFVIALTLSISSFSQANIAVEAITTLRDREANYTYVVPTNDFSRTVGIETVVSSMYRAFEENIEIYFFKEDGKTPIGLYYATDSYGNVKKDSSGNEIVISCIDLANSSNREYIEIFRTKEEAQEHLDIILGGTNVLYSKSENIQNRYENKLIYPNGLYETFKDYKFIEKFGEYEQGSGPSANNITKRVITYILIKP